MASKKDSNIIYKKKPTYLSGLKALSNWLFGNVRSPKELDEIVTKYELDNNIIKRLMSYVYNYPHIVWYINKYMNNLYSFNKFNITELLYSFVYMLDINQRNNSKKAFYLKSDDLADKNKSKIKNLIRDYFEKLYEKQYNDIELNFLYDLFNVGAITTEDVMSMDRQLNDNKQTLKLEDLAMSTNETKNSLVLDLYRNLPDKISSFCSELKNRILERPECKKCELYGKPTVILDTNLEDFGEVDLCFIGLNPGKDEVTFQKPFAGKPGMILRKPMALLPSHVKWVILNVMLCHTPTKKDIKNPEQVIENCRELIGEITSKFPSTCFIPLGDDASKAMGMTEMISKISGKIFKSEDYSVIPIIHPSSANYNSANLEKFNKDFQTILNLFREQKSEVSLPTSIQFNNSSQEQHSSTSSTKKYERKKEEPSLMQPLSGNEFITEITPNLTFFDVREVDGKILKIYIDENGCKKYKLEDYIITFNLKFSDWKDCNQITDYINGFVEVNGKDKSSVIKSVREKLNELKNI